MLRMGGKRIDVGEEEKGEFLESERSSSCGNSGGRLGQLQAAHPNKDWQ
jgi:hypothetical protein